MKVRELFENTSTTTVGDLIFYFECQENLKLVKNRIKLIFDIDTEIKKNINLGKKLDVKESASSQYIIITFNDVDTSLLNKNQLNKIQHNLEQLIIPFIRYYKIQISIRISEVPNHVIEARSIHFKCEKQGTSISKIDKFIKIEDAFYLEDPNKISGGVLSLLNINGVVTIYGNFAPWVDIVNKYLIEDGDILDCQEELISNGLKEYAKL